MTIQWLGNTGFKITGRNEKKEEITLLFDPTKKLKTDFVCFSSNASKNEFPDALVINGAGEYEKKGIFVKGFFTSGKNIFYLVEIEDIKILHLTDLAKSLDEKFLDVFGEIDILLISLRENAHNIIKEIEPKIFIPMNYAKLDEKLTKTLGLKNIQPLDKLTVKKRELTEETRGIILKNSNV